MVWQFLGSNTRKMGNRRKKTDKLDFTYICFFCASKAVITEYIFLI